MLNNFLYNWLIFILSIIFINIIIRLYKYYKYNYLFSINIETFINILYWGLQFIKLLFIKIILKKDMSHSYSNTK
jgi:hypothetical protein